MQNVFITIVLAIYAQLIIKWQMLSAGATHHHLLAKLLYIYQLLSSFWGLSSFVAALIAGLAWIMAMIRVQPNEAYPFVGFTFVIMLLSSSIFFYEPITWNKILGAFFIGFGLYLVAGRLIDRISNHTKSSK